MMKKNYYQILNVKRGWTKIPNAIRHDENLTSDAKVVIEELLSVSGDFSISESGLASSLHLSLVRVKKAIRLLKSAGYIQLIKVKEGSHFSGYKWRISDTSGTFRPLENRPLSNAINLDCNSDRSETDRSETLSVENLSIYEYTERYEQTNNERQKNEQTEWNERLHHQPDVEAEVFAPSLKKDSSWDSSSEANASPLSGKNSNPSGVISALEFKFQQFLKKYPKKPTGSEMEATRNAFFEVVDSDESYAEILAGLDAWCNSVDWNKESGRYITKPLYFLTTRKWEEIPRTIKTEIDEELLRFMNPDFKKEDYGL